MSLCINIKHPDYIKLENSTSISPAILKAKISIWQDQNNTDNFPTLKQLGIEEKITSVKPGVAELFESNPELANAVYEALVLKGYTRLYRAENEKGVDSPAPSWVLEQPEVRLQQEAQGRWFYKSYEEAKYHANKFGSSGISYVDILSTEVENYNAKDNKFSGGYGKDGKEYFVSKELANNRKSFEQQKQQAQQLYSQYLESLNKPNTNPILQGNQTNVEEIITQLEKDGLLEIDCKGKLKAEDGLATSFTKGGKWKVIKDLKGYPTHKQGGVDLTIGKNGVSIKNGNTQFTAKHGLVIPKN